MTTNSDDTFFDRAELLKAMAAPEYATDARYRDELAAKLHRSVQAGTITHMGEQIAHRERLHTRTVTNIDDGLYGDAVLMPLAHQPSAEGLSLGQGVFKTPEQLAAAFSAPAFEIDPTYQDAVREKVARSIREGYLTADFQAADPNARNR